MCENVVLVNPVMKGQKALGRTECLVAHWVQCCCHWVCPVLDFASAVPCADHAWTVVKVQTDLDGQNRETNTGLSWNMPQLYPHTSPLWMAAL